MLYLIDTWSGGVSILFVNAYEMYSHSISVMHGDLEKSIEWWQIYYHKHNKILNNDNLTTVFVKQAQIE